MLSPRTISKVALFATCALFLALPSAHAASELVVDFDTPEEFTQANGFYVGQPGGAYGSMNGSTFGTWSWTECVAGGAPTSYNAFNTCRLHFSAGGLELVEGTMTAQFTSTSPWQPEYQTGNNVQPVRLAAAAFVVLGVSIAAD